MKKKLNISVVDIVNKASSPKNIRAIPEIKKPSTPLAINKLMRFEDLYKIVVGQQNNNNLMGNKSDEIIFEKKLLSKKSTPVPTQRIKKSSVNSTNNNKKSGFNSGISSLANSNKKTMPSSVPSQRIIEPFKENANQNNHQSHSKKKLPQYKKQQAKNINQILQFVKEGTSIQVFINKFQKCLKNLNHEQHCHLRERNQCFLSQNQIDYLLLQLGYNIKSEKHHDFLNLLEVDMYGGAPSSNLRQILEIIETRGTSKDTKLVNIRKISKVIDDNLKMIANQEQKIAIAKYFEDFKPSKEEQKQNHAIFSNRALRKSKHNSIEKLTNYQTQDTQKHITYSSPNKKLSNPVITQLIEALTHSEKKKQENKEIVKEEHIKKLCDEKIEEKVQENLGTFRKIQKCGLDNEGEDYNFSRELTGQRKTPHKQDEDIVELKNRLTQALHKSSLETPHLFDQDKQYNSFLYSNSYKYGKKPILSIDVNLGEGISEKIIVFEGETAKQVSDRLSAKFTISEETKLKFEKILQSHLSTMLWKIDQLSQEMLTDRTEGDLQP